ncbi:MAG: GLPGLI family protein [Patiriisocius sp.]|jgi:GLPGLI family protein
MVKQIINYTFFFLFIFNCYSQKVSGKVNYQKTMIDASDRISKPDSKKRFLAFRKKINSNLKKINYTLEFNAFESIFFSPKVMENDNKREMKLATNLGGGRGLLYINIETKLKLHQADGFGENFLIKGEIEYDWIITQETKIIKGYICYKANLKNDKGTVAYFTKEIPFSFGPNGYCGLPGLILELNLKNGFSFKVKEIFINKKGSKEISKPTKGVKISEKDFLGNAKDKVKKRKN